MLKDNERLDDLEYNGLRIIQTPDGYCFTSDSVLLANLVNVKTADTVVDFCTGSGIIAILIAGKFTPKKVIGIELQPRLAEMAQRSVELNNLQSSVKIINTDVIGVEKIIGDGIADVITVNPPYEKAEEIAEPTEKDICKREICLTLAQCVASAAKVLKYGGLFYMVNKAKRLTDAICAMRENKIEPKKLYLVQPKADREPDTFIIEGKKGAKPSLAVAKPIVVYDDDGNFTDFARRLYNK